MALAFFDLDLTLLSVNSGSLWIRREVALGRLGLSQAARAAGWLVQYRLGLASQREMLEKAIASAQGEPAAQLASRTRSFYETQVAHRFRPGGLDAVEAHRAQGDRLALLTSSSHFLGELAGAQLGFDEVLCNRLQVGPDGRLTGRAEGTICFGDGKRVLAEASAAKAGVPLSDCTFYTDSFSDLPVLEVVGRPVVVHPDPRLKRHAKAKGWPIVDWGEARASLH